MRSGAAGAIGKLSPRLALSLRTAVERWIVSEELDLALSWVLSLASLLTTRTLVTLARRGLASDSPTQRHKAIGVLAILPTERARTLAMKALLDEPDPALRHELERCGLDR